MKGQNIEKELSWICKTDQKTRNNCITLFLAGSEEGGCFRRLRFSARQNVPQKPGKLNMRN